MASSLQPGSFTNTYPGPHQDSSDLPLGRWSVLANGRVYTLTIHGVTANGVDAEFSSGDVQNAAWDPVTRQLTFNRVTPLLNQKFTGFLMQYDRSDPFWRLAGFFEHAELRAVAGWYATLPR